MWQRWALACALLVGCAVEARAVGDALTFAQRASVPPWALEALVKSGLDSQYEMCACLNPFYQRGDFNGDGVPDLAVLARQRSTQKVGIVFLFGGRPPPVVVGAGRAFGAGGDDFNCIDAWYVSAAPTRKAAARRVDALSVEKTEAASALIRWNGKGFDWTQQGD